MNTEQLPPSVAALYAEPPRPPKRRGWKIAFLAWNGLMAAWLIAGFVGLGTQMNDCATETYQEACEAGTSLGGAAAIGFVLFVAVAINVIMAIFWAITRPRQHQVVFVPAPPAP